MRRGGLVRLPLPVRIILLREVEGVKEEDRVECKTLDTLIHGRNGLGLIEHGERHIIIHLRFPLLYQIGALGWIHFRFNFPGNFHRLGAVIPHPVSNRYIDVGEEMGPHGDVQVIWSPSAKGHWQFLGAHFG